VNENQRWLTTAAIVWFVVSFFFAPWKVKNLVDPRDHLYVESHKFSALWKAPENILGSSTLQTPILLAEWLGLGVVYAGVFMLLKNKR
jgi:hypothetical protein